MKDGVTSRSDIKSRMPFYIVANDKRSILQ